MSRLKLGKKLQPAKKAWKSFSNKMQSKLHKLSIPRAMKATFKRLLATLHSLHHLVSSRGHRSLAGRRSSYAASDYRVHGKNISAIRIDDLFPEPASSMVAHANKTHSSQGETSRGRVVIEKKKDLAGGNSGVNTLEDAWKAVVAKSPQLQVDQKAEEFISKFREDMRLQKERSLLEFQEMLARGA
ncbi:uncharacterized protein LOC106770987 [Vigna radiata var. radiata]|uniref:Uncharacterized protein LOC106770987 n=1 Tax=Vigna radiata var. radiata TaxID=3916 RepID=A0A1S3V1X0_VIGRR|nr:uncharacterized protein LOC106770987 [Vigna radiata var. radiata]